MTIDSEIYSNPDKLYQVKLLKTDKSGGYFKTLKEALSKQKEYETKDWYATIIRVNPKTQASQIGLLYILDDEKVIKNGRF
jgi:hypothetical protein